MPPNHGLGVGGRGIMDVARVVFLAVLFSGIWSGIAWASPRYEGRVQASAEKSPVLLNTSQAQTGRTFSQLSFFLLDAVYRQKSVLAYLTGRLSQLIMTERRCLYIIMCFYALHHLVKGFEIEGHDGNKKHQLFTKEPCLSILATDLESYRGK